MRNIKFPHNIHKRNIQFIALTITILKKYDTIFEEMYNYRINH